MNTYNSNYNHHNTRESIIYSSSLFEHNQRRPWPLPNATQVLIYLENDQLCILVIIYTTREDPCLYSGHGGYLILFKFYKCSNNCWIGNFNLLEGLAPYGDQTSSSCGGLVAFSHKMGALWPPLDKYKYIYSANTNTYIAEIQIHIRCKYKYNNGGQICYGVVVVVVVQNIFRLG